MWCYNIRFIIFLVEIINNKTFVVIHEDECIISVVYSCYYELKLTYLFNYNSNLNKYFVTFSYQKNIRQQIVLVCLVLPIKTSNLLNLKKKTIQR